MQLGSRVVGMLGFVALSVAVSSGCDRESGSGGGASAVTSPTAAQTPAATAEAGYFAGRITLADGSPITLPGVKYKVTINGVTHVGENNAFHPPVAADGTFKLKLPQGLFYPPFASITFPFNGKNYVADLDLVDRVEGTRDGSAGITGNFVWRMTGPQPSALNPDVNNATHWYGITIPVPFSAYREDTQQSVKPPPDGTKVAFTLKPTSKRIDGAEAMPVKVERKWTDRGSLDALNDLPPADYEVSAVATMPDGSTKPALLYDMDDRKYKPSAKIVLMPYANGGTVCILPAMLHWVLE